MHKQFRPKEENLMAKKRHKRYCQVPGCPTLTDYGYFCPAHKAERQKLKPKPKDDKRPAAHKRGYDAKWKKFRDYYISLEPLCEICGGIGDLVDHIEPLPEGDHCSSDNSQTLCNKCHHIKTKRDKEEKETSNRGY
jgi:5-methylcytosine-specific restriction protein A